MSGRLDVQICSKDFLGSKPCLTVCDRAVCKKHGCMIVYERELQAQTRTVIRMITEIKESHGSS